MPFTEDLSVFTTDFGVAVTSGAGGTVVSTHGLGPDVERVAERDAQGYPVESLRRVVRVPAGVFPQLVRHAPITVAGVAHRVRSHGPDEGDGAFERIVLEGAVE